MISNISADTFAVVVYLVLNRVFPPYESFVSEPVHDFHPEMGTDQGYYTGDTALVDAEKSAAPEIGLRRVRS